jgi:prepilin-type N-terminal cleavage/methylation domain-containing protein
MLNIKRQRGFTLIELVLVIMIVGVLSVFSTRFIAQALNAFLQAQNVTSSTWQARLAYTRLVRDLRQIRSPTDVTTFTASEIAFTDMSGASFDYVLTGTALTLNGETLADGVTGTFSYLTSAIGTATTAATIKYITFILQSTEYGSGFTFESTADMRDFSS